jgi:hypothetical protein
MTPVNGIGRRFGARVRTVRLREPFLPFFDIGHVVDEFLDDTLNFAHLGFEA